MTTGGTPASVSAWAERLYEALRRSAEVRRNETELREDAELVLRAAVEELFGLTDLHVTAERDSRPTGSRSPYDKLYGGVVLEWEWRMSSPRRAHGAQQAINYMSNLRTTVGRDGVITAAVCDGREWGFLAIDPPEGELDFFGVTDVPAVDRFEWRANSPEACRRFLELVGSHSRVPLTSAGLAAGFGPHDPDVRRCVSVLVQAIAAREEADRTDTLYREWRRLLDVVYGDLGAVGSNFADIVSATYEIPRTRPLGELLYALHTYFALIARLLAVEVLAVSYGAPEARPTSWLSLSDAELSGRLELLDRGEILPELDIENLFEGDLFSWFLSDCAANSDLLRAIRDLLHRMDDFAFPRVAFGANPVGDLLRDLYQDVVPRELRLALGEFLTPAWLAEACLERLSADGANLVSGRVLDPTCGTGTFLMPLLRHRLARLRRLGDRRTPQDVQAALMGVVGFDINPVAVVAARVNYLVALGDLATAGHLTLPVYQADSVLLPEAPVRQGNIDDPGLVGRQYREVQTSLPRPFPVPEAAANAEGLRALRHALEESIDDPVLEAGMARFESVLEIEIGPGAVRPLAATNADWMELLGVARVLFAYVWDLEQSDRDRVWARLIENRFAPVFAGHFDVVVGNPPWIAWNKLPQDWRQAAEPVWRRYDLWRVPLENGRRSNRPATTDLAALVFARAMEKYARPDGGFVGLLTPESLVRADPSGRGFRRFRLTEENAQGAGSVFEIPFRIASLDDWSDVQPFSPDASNKPVFLVGQRDSSHVYPVPTYKWSRASRGTRLQGDWRHVEPLLTQTIGESNPVDRSVATSAWSFQGQHAPLILEGGTNRWNFGIGIHTRGGNGIFLVRVIRVDRLQGRAQVVNDTAAGRNPAAVSATGWVELDLVHPYLRGSDVHPWSATASSFILAAYDPADVGRYLPDVELRRYSGAYSWLRRNFPALSTRNAPPRQNWNVAGPDWCRLDGPMGYMGSDWTVVVREIQNAPAAAVIRKRFNETTGRIQAPLIDHKLMLCAVASEDEALYLCALINSTPIQQLIGSFGMSTSMSPRTLARLPIPDYSGQDLAVALVEEARSVDRDPNPSQAAEQRRIRMDGLVSELLGQPVAERAQRAGHVTRQNPPAAAESDQLF